MDSRADGWMRQEWMYKLYGLVRVWRGEGRIDGKPIVQVGMEEYSGGFCYTMLYYTFLRH